MTEADIIKKPVYWFAKQIVYFTFLCGASEGFTKILKAFIKPFEAPQRSAEIKFKLFFISIQLSEMHGAERVKKRSL